MEQEIKRLVVNHQKKLILSVLAMENSDRTFKEVYKVVILGKKLRAKRVKSLNPQPKAEKTPKSELNCIARNAKLTQCQNKAELNCEFCLKHTETRKFGTMNEEYVKPEKVVGEKKPREPREPRVVTESSCIARNAKGNQCVFNHLEGSEFCKRHGEKLEYGTIHDEPLVKKTKKSEKTQELSTLASQIAPVDLDTLEVGDDEEEQTKQPDDDEEEINVEEFVHNGITYWKDQHNTIYDEEDNEIGTYDPEEDTIDFA
jgi:hypothetical protein